MNRRDVLVLGVAGVAGASGNALAGDTATRPLPLPPPPSADSARAEVEARLAFQRDAWNRGDLEGFCADYADDAVFLSPGGLTRGRADVLARYLKKYGTAKSTMGTLSFETIDVIAGATVVSMAMRWKLDWQDKPSASGLTLITWVKRGPRWFLAQDASM